MANSSSSSSSTWSGGIGALGLLGCIFVVAKLLGLITWSWWLVLLTFYIGLVVVLGLLFVGVALAGIAFGFVCLLEYFANRKWRKNAARVRSGR